MSCWYSAREGNPSGRVLHSGCPLCPHHWSPSLPPSLPAMVVMAVSPVPMIVSVGAMMIVPVGVRGHDDRCRVYNCRRGRDGHGRGVCRRGVCRRGVRLGCVIDRAGGSADPGADQRPSCSVAGRRANGCPTPGPDRRAGECAAPRGHQGEPEQSCQQTYAMRCGHGGLLAPSPGRAPRSRCIGPVRCGSRTSHASAPHTCKRHTTAPWGSR